MTASPLELDTPPSLARSSIARFVSDAGGVFLGMIGGIITARVLGPAGKGTLSSLLFLGSLFVEVCSLGLGDAAIVAVGGKKWSLQQAVSGTIAPLLITTSIGMGVFLISAGVVFPGGWGVLGVAIATQALVVTLAVHLNVLSHIVNATERIVFTSLVFGVVSLLTTVGLAIFVLVMDWGVSGGVAAGLLGTTAGFLLVIRKLVLGGVSLRPRWVPGYLRVALRLGLVIQAAYLLIVASQRLDQLLVFHLAGEVDAGHYSVALTLGQLVLYGPYALSMASFPRTALLSDADIAPFIAQLSRIGLAAGFVCALVLAVAIPLGTPLLFGSTFDKAVVPALILVVGGLFWGEQWLLCRARAARGETGLLFVAFGVSLTLMVILDRLLIPIYGINGAAAASAISSVVGAAVALTAYGRDRRFSLEEFWPRWRDFKSLISLPRQVLMPRTADAIADHKDVRD